MLLRAATERQLWRDRRAFRSLGQRVRTQTNPTTADVPQPAGVRAPPRPTSLRELGPENFAFGGVDFVREDSQLTNARGLRLECSMWHRARLPEGGAPCVLYLHGNASCRAEALQVISAVLATGASLFAFDFAGCGQSEGEYISLGWHEQDDV